MFCGLCCDCCFGVYLFVCFFCLIDVLFSLVFELGVSLLIWCWILVCYLWAIWLLVSFIEFCVCNLIACWLIDWCTRLIGFLFFLFGCLLGCLLVWLSFWLRFCFAYVCFYVLCAVYCLFAFMLVGGVYFVAVFLFERLCKVGAFWFCL